MQFCNSREKLFTLLGQKLRLNEGDEALLVIVAHLFCTCENLSRIAKLVNDQICQHQEDQH